MLVWCLYVFAEDEEIAQEAFARAALAAVPHIAAVQAQSSLTVT